MILGPALGADQLVTQVNHTTFCTARLRPTAFTRVRARDWHPGPRVSVCVGSSKLKRLVRHSFRDYLLILRGLAMTFMPFCTYTPYTFR
jgi:hypothetical protein